MRIISGEFRSRIIQAPEGTDTRPTSEKAREALFSILQNRIYGTRFLDLFAGSGAMGLEALSRGAGFSVMIDSSREAVRVIKANIAALGVQDRAEVYCAQAQAGIARLSGRFDTVFLDPPYKQACIPTILEQLLKYGVLAKNAVVIAEHEEDFLPCPGFEITRQRKYGRAQFTFLQAKE